MFFRLISFVLVLVVFILFVFVDVILEQVWQFWIDYYELVGYIVVEVGCDMVGLILMLCDVIIEGGVEGNKVVSCILQVILMQENGGKVCMVFVDQMDMDVSGIEEGSVFSLFVVILMFGNVIVILGVFEDMIYEFDYFIIDVMLSMIILDGVEWLLLIMVKLVDMIGIFYFVVGMFVKYDYIMVIQKLIFQGDVIEEVGDQMKFVGSFDVLCSEGMMIVGGKFIDLEGQMFQVLKDGLVISGKLVIGLGVGMFEFVSIDVEGQFLFGLGKYDGKGMDLFFNLFSDGMGYQGVIDVVSFEMILL